MKEKVKQMKCFVEVKRWHCDDDDEVTKNEDQLLNRLQEYFQ
jgi:hypothetical protein